MDELTAFFEPYYLGVAATLEKAGELAAGVEAWLVGSPPHDVAHQADEYDSRVRLRLTTVEFGSASEQRINQLFVSSAGLRSAYRGSTEVIRLLTILGQDPEARAPLALVGDSLLTQARLAPPVGQRLSAEQIQDNLRRGRATETAALTALAAIPRYPLLPKNPSDRRLVQRACLVCLAIAGQAFGEAVAIVGGYEPPSSGVLR